VVSRILVILDGAPEPLRSGPTALERAATPALDALCAHGTVGRLATTPPDHVPGSETGIPALLGGLPPGQAGRGPIEAAAAGIALAPGEAAWRLDLYRADSRRATGAQGREALAPLRAALPHHRVVALRGHRLLAIGTQRPELRGCGGLTVRVWPGGERLRPSLTRPTTMVCGPGAAGGIGRLLGARVVVPAGTTGDVDSDLGAKAAAACRALELGDDVVVHVGAADEAAHRREPEAKRRALEEADARLLAPLRLAAQRAGATLTVTADHGTCPRTGRHDSEPVPYVCAGPDTPALGPGRLTERAVASCTADDPARRAEVLA